MTTTPFKFNVGFDAFEKSGEPKGMGRRIGGICSTDSIDKDGEVLLQEGLDFGPFLKSGCFNDNHNSDTAAILGYPTMAELRKSAGGRKGWYIEGYLLEDYAPADRIWNLAKSLQNTGRRLGFSVEGAIVERDAENRKLVKKAVVKEVAITRCPVNNDTSLNVLAKSLGWPIANPAPTPATVQRDGTIPKIPEQSLELGDLFQRLVEDAVQARLPGVIESVLPGLVGKMLSAGYGRGGGLEGPSGSHIGAPGAGTALRVESLETDDNPAMRSVVKSLSKSEATRYLMMRHPQLSARDAEALAHFAVTHFPAAQET